MTKAEARSGEEEEPVHSGASHVHTVGVHGDML